jgi:hypothetical protein
MQAGYVGEAPDHAPGCTSAGRGPAPRRAWVPEDVPLPERILLADTTVDGRDLLAVSYHAPPGVSWGITKPRQAVAFARRLSVRQGPVLMGADANTPLIDAADFAATCTHWHTGDRHLNGEPGDDLFWISGHWTVRHIAHLYERASPPEATTPSWLLTSQAHNTAADCITENRLIETRHWAWRRAACGQRGAARSAR